MGVGWAGGNIRNKYIAPLLERDQGAREKNGARTGVLSARRLGQVSILKRVGRLRWGH